MKKLIIYTLIVLAIPCQAQDYYITLYFENATGDRDTVVLGQAETASDGYDVEYDGPNLINEPYADDLNVRLVTLHNYSDNVRAGDWYESKVNYSQPGSTFYVTLSTRSLPFTVRYEEST